MQEKEEISRRAMPAFPLLTSKNIEIIKQMSITIPSAPSLKINSLTVHFFLDQFLFWSISSFRGLSSYAKLCQIMSTIVLAIVYDKTTYFRQTFDKKNCLNSNIKTDVARMKMQRPPLKKQ